MKNHPLQRFLRRRDRDSFTRLVETERDRVLGAAWRVLGDRSLAEDVTQEVFVHVLESDWKPGSIRSAEGLLVHLALQSARTRRRSDERRTRREGEREPPEGEELAETDAAEIRAAVEELPDGLKSCVELRYFGGLAAREIGDRLGLAKRTVNDRLTAARERLRDRLAPHAYGAVAVCIETDTPSPGGPAVSPELEARLSELSRHASLAGVGAGSTAGLSAWIGWIGTAVALVAATVVTVALTGSGDDTHAEPGGRTVAETAPSDGHELVAAGGDDATPRVEANGEGSSGPPVDRSPSAGVVAEGTALVIHVVDEAGDPVLEGALDLGPADMLGWFRIDELGEDSKAAALAWLLDPIPLDTTNPLMVGDLPSELCGIEFEARALAPGFASAEPTVFELVEDETTEITLVLPSPRDIEFVVRESGSGDPIAGATAISITELDRRDIDVVGPEQAPGIGVARTDAGGRCTLAGLGGGEHTIEVYAPGYRTSRFDESEEPERREVRLERIADPATIVVSVHDPEGRPIPDAVVECGRTAEEANRVRRTDVLGECRFEELVPGRYDVRLELMAFATLSHEKGWSLENRSHYAMTVVGAGEVREIALGYLPGSSSWTVELVDGAGEPVVGQEVSVMGPVTRDGETDARGFVAFDELPPGEWNVYIRGRETWRPKTRAISAGELARDRYVLGDAVLRGRVVHAGTREGLPGVQLSAVGDYYGYAQTDAEGRFEIAGAPPGEYVVVVRVDGLSCPRRTVVVPAGESPDELVIEAFEGGRIVVRLANGDPAAFGVGPRVVQQDGVATWMMIDPEDRGCWRSRVVLPGENEVVLDIGDGRSVRRTVDVGIGEEVEVTLELPEDS